jgi:peptidoglycan/xylan/chitin deacetylase (PgdA/CDA1 family)
MNQERQPLSTQPIVYLMYHEIELPGRPLCQSEPGYVRYILTDRTFRDQMQWMKQSGFRGLSVGEALHYPQEPAVCITFDDGCETDLIAASPVLRAAGFHATFYITTGFLGTPGHLSAQQLRELDALGFEIGCHSMTHPYLPDLPELELKREIVDAKLEIEQILGHAIEHFSCPGGRYDGRTLEMARRAGFRSVANSLCRVNSANTSPFALGRVAIRRGVSAQEFATICEGRGLWKKQLLDRTRLGLQQLLGNQTYDRIRAILLGG